MKIRKAYKTKEKLTRKMQDNKVFYLVDQGHIAPLEYKFSLRYNGTYLKEYTDHVSFLLPDLTPIELHRKLRGDLILLRGDVVKSEIKYLDRLIKLVNIYIDTLITIEYHKQSRGSYIEKLKTQVNTKKE